VTEPSRFWDAWLYATNTIPTVRPKAVLADRSGQSLIMGRGEPAGFRVLFEDVVGILGRANADIRFCYYCDLTKLR
jgi:hypothetical protein